MPADEAQEALAGALADLEAFARLLEAEWYNGNLTEPAFDRLNADITGIVAKYRATLSSHSEQEDG